MTSKERLNESNKKWRESNPDKWREACKRTGKTYYEKHKEEKQQKVYARYRYKKEVSNLLNILNGFFE